MTVLFLNLRHHNTISCRDGSLLCKMLVDHQTSNIALHHTHCMKGNPSILPSCFVRLKSTPLHALTASRNFGLSSYSKLQMQSCIICMSWVIHRQKATATFSLASAHHAATAGSRRSRPVWRHQSASPSEGSIRRQDLGYPQCPAEIRLLVISLFHFC